MQDLLTNISELRIDKHTIKIKEAAHTHTYTHMQGLLTNISELRIDEHVIKVPPREVIEQGIDQTLRYLRNVHTARETASLDLSSMGNPNFPLISAILPDIVDLKLYNNNLVHLPDAISRLTALRSLHLSDNLLVDLPEEIGHVRIYSYMYTCAQCVYA
jgi:Leucine-rich repeat (LRR) protein